MVNYNSFTSLHRCSGTLRKSAKMADLLFCKTVATNSIFKQYAFQQNSSFSKCNVGEKVMAFPFIQ